MCHFTENNPVTNISDNNYQNKIDINFANKNIVLTFAVSMIAEWSSWQLVGLITQRSEVRVLSPLLIRDDFI